MVKVLRFIEKLNERILTLLCILFGLMVVLIVSQVLLRNIFQFSIHWAEELSRIIMIYTIFIGSAYLYYKQKMLNVDILEQMLHGKGKKIYIILINVVIFLFYGILTYFAYQLLSNMSQQITATLQISYAWVYLSLFIGTILMIINSFYQIAKVLFPEESEAT